MTVIALAEATIDWLCLEPGQTLLTATEFYRYAGGNAANVAAGLARLGVPTRLLAKVGDDFHARYLMNCWQQAGVDLSCLIVDERYPTAQCYMTLSLEGEPDYRNWPSINASHMLESSDLERLQLGQPHFVHTSAISLLKDPRRSTVVKYIGSVSESGSVVCFDACLPPNPAAEARSAALAIMERCDILKVNLTELRYWGGIGTLEESLERVTKMTSATAVIVTLGDQGAALALGTERYLFPAHAVDCVCDVGAGDAFIAGLIYGLHRIGVASSRDLKGLFKGDWKAAIKPALVCGALVTRRIGATEGFPSRQELEEVMSALPPSDQKEACEA